jgi:hypothetical protein
MATLDETHVSQLQANAVVKPVLVTMLSRSPSDELKFLSANNGGQDASMSEYDLV